MTGKNGRRHFYAYILHVYFLIKLCYELLFCCFACCITFVEVFVYVLYGVLTLKLS